MEPLDIAVILGSTREGRVGAEVARWFLGIARRRADLAADPLDLAEFRFPRRYPATPHPAIRSFAARIGAADGFVVVTPEYNRSFPAPLKEAIDYAYDEWRAKPVGFVSYGCGSLGLHAVDQLRAIFTELHTVTMRDGVALDLLTTDLPLPCTHIRDTRADAADHAVSAAGRMLDQMTWWGRALRGARAEHPYVS